MSNTIVSERNLSLCPSRFIVLSLITRTEDNPLVDLKYWVSAWELISTSRLLVYFSFILTTDKYEMVRRLSLRPDLPPLDTETNITGSVHVASPTLFKSPTWDTDDDSHKPLRDFKLISRRRSTQDLGFGSGSGFGDEKYSSYLIGSGSSAGMMDGSPMFGILTESQRGRTLSGSSEIGYPVKMVAGPVRLPVSGERDGPTTSASLFLPCATVKDGTCMGRNRESSQDMVSSNNLFANACA
jgi:hypothetical protein